ncbi:SPOR domain-containing protein [Helicobacter bilis]|uniref:SPOR domain-containing protein n=1 Tax=Helicobacter bilis TaxID=37372 RepID=A0A4U8U8D1_9HELI|nr:SPOR domain-containing protein [Helicobacter bilis]MCI7411461.1 SPOR domain-containing protein [Helicobacter bilis]MDD7296718.1 SPOR domain-containing protein [Helicobacter bilis]MDY4400410.1 SPOR domain-containing protein [Helicobacter bilis]TLE08669.1 SPOR domain-containing protein [Helicobacter bilis]TLE09702.1 SPOR domain-containing protein [Helicobacter bilis]
MKDDNKAVNDIFQNDNGSKNKTKTILLLTIVAIILISVFLIIAWVMTRDNPLQDMQNQAAQNQNKDGLALNEPKDRTLPYAHNLDSQTPPQNPLGLDTNRDSLKPQESEAQVNNPMSNVPPLGVPTNADSMPTTSTKPSKGDDLENDARFQAALRDLEKQHNDKKNIDKNTESKKEEAKKEEPKKAEAKKPEPKKQEPAKIESTKPKDSEKETKKPNDNIIPKPQNNVVSANQGKAPEQGYYLQVGVFTQTPAQSFLNKIAKYNYRVLKTEEDGVTKSKYLIGPYISKNKAKEAEQKVREEVESKANVIFYQRQAK